MSILNDIAQLLKWQKDNPLLFSSGLFWYLFLLFFTGYTFIRDKPSIRNLTILVFSVYFYYKCSGVFLFLLLLNIVLNHYLAHGIVAAETDKTKRAFLISGIVYNLLVLGYFKYTNFFVNSLNSTGLFAINGIDVILSIGISFYTFQSISYLVDVYKKLIPPFEKLKDFAFLVTFFPHMVAGPIVRAADFREQILKNRKAEHSEFTEGLWLICVGLFKKAVISDYISINYVDRIFDNPLLYSGFENLMAVYGYALQIYFDFSGYSDMAIGLALLLGFRIKPNFNRPYLSVSVTEFWRRWHIALSDWLRDYLYIPLGGNRKGEWRTYLNLFLTMLLGGLWHGAGWTFIVWGAVHGAALAVERALKPYLKYDVWWSKILGGIVTFHIICVCWVLFRAKTWDISLGVFTQIFTFFTPAVAGQWLAGYTAVVWLMALGYLFVFLPPTWKDQMMLRYQKMHWSLQALSLAAVLVAVLQSRSADIQPFIYFQF